MDWNASIQKNEFIVPSIREWREDIQQIEEDEGIRALLLGRDDKSNLSSSLTLKRQTNSKKNWISPYYWIIRCIGQPFR